MLSKYFATSASSFPCQWVLPWEAKSLRQRPPSPDPELQLCTHQRQMLWWPENSSHIPQCPHRSSAKWCSPCLCTVEWASISWQLRLEYLYTCSAVFGISLWSHLINLTSFASFFSLSCESAASATELCGQQQTRNKFLFKRGLDLLNHVIIACVQSKCIKHCHVALRSQSNWTVSPLDTELGLAWRWEKFPSQIPLVACSGLKKSCLVIFCRFWVPFNILQQASGLCFQHLGIRIIWTCWTSSDHLPACTEVSSMNGFLKHAEYHPPKKTGASDAFQNKLCKFYLVLSISPFQPRRSK